MFSKQEAQEITTSDEEEYRAEKMALLIQELLFDEKGTWISTSYSTTLLPRNQPCDDSSDAGGNSSSRFPVTYTLPDRYIESLTNLDNNDQPLSIIDIESESDAEDFVCKSFQKHLDTYTKDSSTQTPCILGRGQSTTKSNLQRYTDQRHHNLKQGKTNVGCETDEIPTLFSPLDLSPSLDSDSSEITVGDTEVKLITPTKRNYFYSESSSGDSQISAKTDVAVTNLKPDVSTISETSEKNILPTSTTTSSSFQTNTKKSSTRILSKTESRSSYDRDAEQNSDSESFNKSKSVSSSSGSKTKNLSPEFASEVSATPTQILVNPSNQSVTKNLQQLLSQDRRKTQKIYASVSENWNTSHRTAKGTSKVTKSVDPSLRKNLNAQNAKPNMKRQSTPIIWCKDAHNYACRSPPPKYTSTSRSSDSSSNSFLDIFLAKNPSVLLNNSNDRQITVHKERKRCRNQLPWLHKDKQRNYLQISSSRKRKRKAVVSKEKPTLVYFLKSRPEMSFKDSRPQPSVSNNEVKILMPAKPGKMENSETSSNLQSPQPLGMQRTEHNTLLQRLCSLVCKCSCIRRK